MANVLSRWWDLTDNQLFMHFNLHYPQHKPWKLVHPRPEMISSTLSALRSRRPDLDSLLKPPPTKTACGRSKKPSCPLSLESIPTSMPSRHTSTYLFSKYLPRKSAIAAHAPAASLSQLNAFRITYGPSPRRSAWGPNGARTPGTDNTSLNTWN